MAEDQQSIRGSQFRGSRYPGFVSPNVTPSASASSGTSGGGLIDQPSGYTMPDFGAEQTDVPDPTKELGKSVAGAGVTYATTKFGEGAGAALSSGAGFGEAASAGLDKVGQSVSSLFDFSGNAAASAAGNAGASGAGASLASAGGASGGLAGSAGGEAAGMAAGDALGQASQGATTALGGSGGSAASGLGAESFGGRLTSGANLGGALGAGLGTAAVGLLMGQKPAEAAASGLGSGAGFLIGNAIAPGIGGFIGGAIGSALCFAGGTDIMMADGSHKKVEDLRLGDKVLLGGEVLGFGQAYADELYTYRGTKLTASHAVFEEGRWLRAEDSDLAEAVESDQRVIVYPIVTERHLLVTPTFISADLEEIDTTWQHNEAERIEILNADDKRNVRLREWESANLRRRDAA